MVDGLDKVAQRSEREEQVARMKQRSGRIIMNEAIRVDEKGRRWQRIVMFGVIGSILVAGGVVGVLMYLANYGGISKQEAARDTRALLAQYANLAYSIEPLPPGKQLSVEELKQKMVAEIQKELKRRYKTLDTTGKGRGPAKANVRKAIKLLEKALTFNDGQGNPFVIEPKEAGLFIFRSTSGPDTFAEIRVPSAPVTAERP